MDELEASLRAWTKSQLERGRTPFTVARHMLLAAAALLAIHEKLEEQQREPEPDLVDWPDRDDRA
jgi:hypothetical protein